VITIESLTKTYGSSTAVDHVTFQARPGRVTGFLGPNGAGKSTTMRILVGLTRATSGTATISGRAYADLPNPGREVGLLLDASAQHAGRTGRETLTIAQRFMGLPQQRVEEVLDQVSLTPQESSRRVRDYSLGMRQRLGLATALLGEPEVLILDEPANGLDPSGIRWMRGLLRDHADRGGTVLLSSHLLREIEVVADDLVLIGNGRVVAQGAKSEMLRSTGSLVRTSERHRVAAALTASGISSSPVGTDGLLAHADAEQVGKVVFAAGVQVTELRPADNGGLEDIFLELTAGRSPLQSEAVHHAVPLHRIVTIELRKMFDTRAGYWLMASIGITALLATGGVALFASDTQSTYANFTKAIGFPMTATLPIVAILSVTSEWSQRSGLTTFTLVPGRHRVILAKAIASTSVAVVSTLLAFPVGAVGNLLSATLADRTPVWDVTTTEALLFLAGNVLGLLTGFMLGVLIRNSAGAVVGYFIYTFVPPTVFGLWAASQKSFANLRGWVDVGYAQQPLLELNGGPTQHQWAQIGVTAVCWLLLPLIGGLALVMKSEVK
jgi:ABC-2 type transport system ATP-binding protein